jgi:hypothetical protein
MPRQDPVTGGLLDISIPEYKVQEGRYFQTSAVNTSMGSGDTLSIALKTPATPNINMTASFKSKASAHFDIVEGVTWVTSLGTQNPIYNRDRNSTIFSTVSEDVTGSFVSSNNAILNPASLANGTIIDPDYTWTEEKTTVKEKGTAALKLKNSTQYAFRLTADEATNAGQVKLNWYELTDIK